MARRGGVRIGFLIAALVGLLSGCGRAPPLGQSEPTPGPSISLSNASPSDSPSQEPWDAYTDKTYGFSLQYPNSFLSESLSGRTTRKGELSILRFFDKRFDGKYPDGQIEILVYAKDESAEPIRWVQAHSRAKSAPHDDSAFFPGVTNLTTETVAGHSAAQFDWDGDEAGIVHAVAFYYENYVVVIEWFASASYQLTIEPIFSRMLSSWRD